MTAPAGPSGATPQRRGLSYFVPGARVVRLAAQLPAAAERGDVLPADVLGDLTRAEVTRVNSGAAQYTLTFNNWYLTTAADRESDRTTSEQLDSPTRVPAWPRFKYNAFTQLAFGQRLRVEMRYLPEPGGARRDADAEEATWTPMVSGPVTDMSFTFATGAGAQLTVSGEDDLSTLKDKQAKRLPMDRLAEMSIVRQVLQHVGYPLALAGPLVHYPPFVHDDRQGIEEALHSGQSALDFLQKLAERLDFEVFLEYASLDDPKARDDPAAAQRLHFEPYRGRAVPEKAGVFRLDRERTLLDFAPTIKVVDQYSAVEVKGRHRDPLLAREVVGKATRALIADELHIDESLDRPLASGPEVRDHFFPKRPNLGSVPNQPNVDEVRADWYAAAVIRRRARELFTIEASTLGLPRLRPGRFVEIRGMRAPFDGFYYVTKTVHTYGTDGLRTRVTASRPGMELPQSGVTRDTRKARS